MISIMALVLAISIGFLVPEAAAQSDTDLENGAMAFMPDRAFESLPEQGRHAILTARVAYGELLPLKKTGKAKQFQSVSDCRVGRKRMHPDSSVT